MNSKAKHTETERVNQFFHILGSVSMPHGCVEIHPGEFEITRYSSCCNTSKGIYYYTTYENKQITAVDMHKENLEENRAISYPLLTSPNILPQN
jgi:choloylglycine hydrolase